MKTTCISCGRLIPSGQGGRCRAPSCSPRRYRSSAAWQARRQQALAAARGRCWGCGSTTRQLDVHHVEQLAVQMLAGVQGDLVALCGPCHDQAHGRRARDT